MTAFTSKATGNWSSTGQTTWNQAGSPTTGDTVQIQTGHTITVDTNQSIGGSPAINQTGTGTVATVGSSTTVTGTGTAFTTQLKVGDTFSVTGLNPRIVTAIANDLSLTISKAATISAGSAFTFTPSAVYVIGTGSLTIAAGVTLTLKGDIKLSNSVLTLSAGAILTFDSSAAPTPATDIYQCWIGTTDSQTSARVTSNGTSVSRCTIQSNSGGGNGRFVANGLLQSGLMTTAYTDFTRIGDATNDAITMGSSAAADVFSITNSIFDTCGRIAMTFNVVANSRTTLQNITFKNSLHSTDNLSLRGGAAIGTGVRLLDNCVCDKIARWLDVQAWTITNNFLTNWVVSGASWALFNNNFLYKTSVNETTIAGDCTTSYCLINTNTNNPHFLIALNFDRAMTVDGFIFEYTGTDPTGDCILVGTAATAARILTVKNCIKLPNSAGTSSGTFISSLGNANAVISATHNTYHLGGALDSSGIRYNETYAGYAGMYSAIKSNLAWDTTPQGYILCALTLSAITDEVTAANCDYNGQFNAASGTHNNVGGSANQTLAGYENIKITAAPDAHGVTGNPNFIDSSRNLAKWDTSLGGAGTVANAITELKKLNDASGYNSAYTIAALLTYVKAGFAPTNSIYHNTAHDGTDIGAVAFVSIIPRISLLRQQMVA